MELVFQHGMTNYPAFVAIEQKQNVIYSFYHNSPKRWEDLVEFAGSQGVKPLKLDKVIKTR